MKLTKLKSMMPNYKMPNLGLPKGSKSTDKITSLFKDNNKVNTNGIFKEAKSKIPAPLQKFVPNLDTSGNNLDIKKITKESASDVDGILSKSMDMSSISKAMQYDSAFNSDIDISSVKQYIPSDVLSSMFKL